MLSIIEGGANPEKRVTLRVRILDRDNKILSQCFVALLRGRVIGLRTLQDGNRFYPPLQLGYNLEDVLGWLAKSTTYCKTEVFDHQREQWRTPLTEDELQDIMDASTTQVPHSVKPSQLFPVRDPYYDFKGLGAAVREETVKATEGDIQLMNDALSSIRQIARDFPVNSLMSALRKHSHESVIAHSLCTSHANGNKVTEEEVVDTFVTQIRHLTHELIEAKKVQTVKMKYVCERCSDD